MRCKKPRVSWKFKMTILTQKSERRIPLKVIERRQVMNQRNHLRSRGIAVYVGDSGILELGRREEEYYAHMDGRVVFLGFMSQLLKKRGPIVWVDIGCGLSLALRQGKMILDWGGLDYTRLRTYGVDARSLNRSEMESAVEGAMGGEYCVEREVLSKKYRPTLIKADAHYVKFPEKADLVTGVQVLQYCEDPLKVFANVMRQTNIGGLVSLCNFFGVMHREDDERLFMEKTLPQQFYDMQKERNLGFKFVGAEHPVELSRRLFVRKTHDVYRGKEVDFTCGLRLKERTKGKNICYSHYYVPRS
jgi:hypothetical protein